MRFLLSILFCLWCSVASAAIGIVSGVCTASSADTSVTTTGINTTGANIIFVAVGYYPSVANGGGINVPTDSKSNTWYPLNTYTSGATGTAITVYYAFNPITGTSQTFTETGLTNYPGICVIALNTVNSNGFLDQQTGNHGTSGSTLNPGNITPTQNNELALTFIALGGTSTASSFSINSSYTIEAQEGGSTNGQGAAIGYLLQTTATATNPQWSWTGGGANFAGDILSIVSQPSSSGINTLIIGNNIQLGNNVSIQ